MINFIGKVNKYNMALKMSTKIFDLIYPIGSIYLCTHDTNPSVLFGGTWQKMSGGYLYGCSNSVGNSTYTGDKTQSHILTVDEIPSHNHKHRQYIFNGARDNGTKYGITYNNAKGSVNDASSYSDSGQLMFGNFPTGGGQGHTHNIAYIGVWVWKRIG